MSEVQCPTSIFKVIFFSVKFCQFLNSYLAFMDFLPKSRLVVFFYSQLNIYNFAHNTLKLHKYLQSA